MLSVRSLFALGATSLRRTSFRTFILYPLIVVAWEWLLNGGRLYVRPWFLPLLVWGFLQYWLIGKYRIRHGGGGPGMDTPPERLVTTGPFAWCRNPMYLGHIVFLLGLALTLQSPFAALLTAAIAVWFHFRVRRDETRLRKRFGQPYQEYLARVRRWIPRPPSRLKPAPTNSAAPTSDSASHRRAIASSHRQ